MLIALTALLVLAGGLWISSSQAEDLPALQLAQAGPPGANPPQPGGSGERPGPGGHGMARQPIGQLGQRPEPPDFDRMGGMLGLVGKFRNICADPEAMGVYAVGTFKEEVKRKPAEMVREYEALLKDTKSLPLRNAIRLAMKDLYKAQGDDNKVLEVLRAIIAENDAAIQARPTFPPRPAEEKKDK